jgi:succinate-semialdehyde dehydrogenase / glutarate-semialdehyde dehydrogenase
MIEVRNPRTGLVDYRFAPPADLETACASARASQISWESNGVKYRSAAFASLHASLLKHRASIQDALVADTGRLTESVLEFDATLGMLTRWSSLGEDLLAEPHHRPASIPGFEIGQGFRPYPLVAVISPWNFPLLLACIDAIPALIAGCSVIVKPSEVTPRFVEPLQAAIAEVPELAGVLTFIQGDGETGRQLIALSDLVCFTGSVATGRAVARQAAELFIPAFLELGGKDPAIVTADADLDRASSAILWGGTANAGQSCLSIERVYVDRSVFDEFTRLLAAKASDVTLAVPGPADGMLGPVIAERQIDIIKRHLEDAFSKGAKALSGGTLEVIDGATFLKPTVLVNVDHSMLVMTEETFGPILPVMACDGIDALIDAANQTRFGLSAAVFDASPATARRIGARIDAGAISINDAALTALIHEAEKQSFKESGLGGSRMGPAALRRFGRRQAFLAATSTQPDPWWYPHLRPSR